MLISFKNNKEEEFYNSEKILSARHGLRMARKIGQRISELQAASNPQQLPRSARFHEHRGKRRGLFSIDLVHPFRLIVRPACNHSNWVEITCVEIYEVMKPH